MDSDKQVFLCQKSLGLHSEALRIHIDRCIIYLQTCHDFQAGNVLRSKRKTEKLDVKALFGASCKHEHPLLFCNICHDGER